MTFLDAPESLERSFLARIAEMLGPDTDASVVNPLSFREYIDKTRPGFRWYKHCEKLADILQRVVDGELKRLMVFEPPRHGKSEMVSRALPGYFLYRHPEYWVGLASFGAELAHSLSRDARTMYARSDGLRGRVNAVKQWDTGKGGGMWAAGVGGPILGKGFHLGIIDDPIKNAKEAASTTVREANKEWLRSTFLTREEPWSETDPNGAIVVMMQRWHEDDPAGWLLSLEEDEESESDPERWHIVSFEAIKEATPFKIPSTCTLEPDWRQPGEALNPERRPIEKLRKIEKRIGQYFFSALYQQRPTPLGGSMFTTFPIVDALPSDATRFVRYWDKAGTEGGGDWSVGVLMACTPGGEYFVVDVVRGQWSSSQRNRVIKDTASLDGVHVHQWFEQEPGSGGKESAENSIIMLAGHVAHMERSTGEKAVRAQPLASQAQVGNVKLLRKPWNRAFIEEAQLFPNGRNDDMVDAASGAFNKLTLVPRPATGVARPHISAPSVPQTSGGFVKGIPDGLSRGGF